MTRYWLSLHFALLSAVLPAPLVSAQGSGTDLEDPAQVLSRMQKMEKKLISVAHKVRSATVSIENWRLHEASGVLRCVSGGSGVIIDSKGHALTNQHVVAQAKKLVCVLWDGRRVEASVVGRDNQGDAVVIRLHKNKMKGSFAYATMDLAAVRRLEPGDLVFATGNPFFLATDGDPVLTMGVVSGLGRIGGGKYKYGNSIQHDARINPGNSGGPLWDINGKLVAINGLISSHRTTSPAGASSNGVGYAIPITQIANFLKLMLQGEEKITHADTEFGVEVETATDGDGAQIGVKVTKVKHGSPAALAKAYGRVPKPGIQIEDVVFKVIYKSKTYMIRNRKDWVNVMSPIPGGARIKVSVYRGRRRLTFANIYIPTAEDKKEKGKK